MITPLRLTIATGLVWLLGSAIIILAAPAAPRVAAAAATTSDWALPAPETLDVDTLAARIDAANPWGTQHPQADQAPLTPPEWRILGSAANGEEHLAVVRIEGQAPTTLKVGDALPGGAKICAVDADRLCVVVNGKKRILGIYRE
ncbi:MAG: hypothetical protein JO218_16555 [Burkholderiales bacterium]|nr:hypothetical protein [Burkholderiales bacterium]